MALHFERIAGIAQALGAKVLVFGAPSLRTYHGITSDLALLRAAEAPALAIRPFVCRDLILAIEPVFQTTGGQSVMQIGNNMAECASLVRLVNSPSLRLNLDCAALWESGEDIESGWQTWGEFVCHVHLSEPGLGALRGGLVPHKRNISLLDSNGYDGLVS